LRQLTVFNCIQNSLYYVYLQNIARLLFVNIEFNNSKLELIIETKYLNLY